MAALTGARNTEEYGTGPVARRTSGTIASGQTIYKGALVGRDASGTIVNVSADPTIVVQGIAIGPDESLTAGETCEIDHGARWFRNSTGANAITVAHIGDLVYAADNQTMSLTNQSGTLPPAGKVLAVDSTYGVAVQIGLESLSGRILTTTAQFNYDDTDVAVAATSMTRNILTGFPLGTFLIGYDINTTADWTDGSTGAFNLAVGDGTTANQYGADVGNIDGGASHTGGAICQAILAANVVATITGDVNLDTLTGGASTYKLALALP